MKKENRVKSEKDFKKIFEKRSSKANKQFVIYFLEKENQSHFRVGISVSKKLGNAVVRNSVKRKIRRSIFELSPFIKMNYDIIIIARAQTVEMSIDEMKKSLTHVFNLANLMI